MVRPQVRSPALRFLHPGAVLLLMLAGPAACGGDTSSDVEAGSETSQPSTSVLEERLAMCPAIQLSSDPAASTCLEGTYEGETLAGEQCSLTIGKVGAYEFDSPNLTVSSTPQGKSIFVFDHTRVGNFGQIAWMVNDPLSVDTFYELSFTAQYGSDSAQGNRKVEIEVTRHEPDTSLAVRCVVAL